MSKYLDSDGLLYLWQKIKAKLAGKVDVETGKGLSTNDYTSAEKTKLAGIAEGANAYVHPSYTARTGKPTANQTPGFGGTFTVSQITSDSTGHVSSVIDRTVTIPNTVFKGAVTTAGTAGLVPAPAMADGPYSYLSSGGDWKTFTDKYVQVSLDTTTKAYLLATTTAPVSGQSAQHTAVADTGVYLDTSGGKLTATSFNGNGTNLTDLNASNLGTGTVPAARLPLASSSANGAMSKEDKAKLDAFGAASTYALKTDISSMYKHKGSVATTNDLPSTGNTEGDVYNVTSSGMNYVWVVTEGTGAWDALGEVFTIDSITNSEIDTILAA